MPTLRNAAAEALALPLRGLTGLAREPACSAAFRLHRPVDRMGYGPALLVSPYLADTSAWNRSRLVAERWVELLEADELLLCAPVALELLYSARGRDDYGLLARDLDGFRSLPLDRRAERAALRAQGALAASSQHRGPRPVDLLVAAAAEVHGVPLLHYDRHFELIERVTGQPMEWLAPRGSLR